MLMYAPICGMPTTPIRVLVTDDERSIRAVVRLTLKSHADIIIVAEAHNGHKAVNLALAHAPDVIVMDYEMPGLDGIKATAKIRHVLPTTKVVMFSASHTQQAIDAAFAAGATAFLGKDASHELAPAIRAVVNGRSFVSG